MSDRSGKAPRVAVDALGGDHAPRVVVEGAARAARELAIPVQLVGPREELVQTIRGLGAERLGLEVVEAPEAVGMAEKVTRTTLKKRSSILVAMERLQAGEADAFFSAGNTAACWTIAKMVLGTLEEVDRPALATVVPHPEGRTVMLDVGANSNCKARHLEEFAIMGEVFTKALFRIERPRVGLMSVGEEASKGTVLTKRVHKVLEASGLNFLGNVEGRDLFSGRADVIVMDGFTGNVVLKACEKLAESIMTLLKEQVAQSPASRLGALLCAGAFRGVKRKINASEFGGAPLLGMKGCCVIGHGRSNAVAVMHGIRVAGEFFSSGVNQQIESVLKPLAVRKELDEEVTA